VGVRKEKNNKPGRAPITTPDWQAAVRRKTLFFTLAAVLLAVLFGVLVFHFFASQQKLYQGETRPVLLAGRDLESGTQLSADMLDVVELPVSFLPESYYSAIEQAAGRITIYPLVKGEIILPEKVSGSESGGLAGRCPAERWCISVPEKWFIAAPPDLAVGNRLEIASALPGQKYDEAGFIASDVVVVSLPTDLESPEYVLAVEDQEVLSLLYARVNQYQLMILLRPWRE
jgi:Flp pilus assembly protein CpaB